MNHPTYRFWIGAGLVVMLVLSVSSVWGYADREGGESSRQDQLKQEAQESAGEIKAMLTAILQLANQNLRPEPSVIEQAATLLEDSKRTASAYDDIQKAEYMLLQAWTDFYAGRLPGAVNWSLRACKTDEASQDAWISQALFSQLSGKRPVEPKMQRPDAQPERGNEREGMNRRPTPQPRRRANETTVTRADVVPYSRKGTLEFDVLALRGDMLRERFTRFTYTAAGAATVEYKPGEDTLCAFFWQAEPITSDANDLSGGQPARPAAPRAAEMLNGGYTEDLQGLSLENQQKYVSTVFAACQGQEQITMLQLNTNDRRTAEQLSGTHAAGENMPPLVFAADPDSGAGAFGRVEARVPFMLIADNTGVVRYAGPAKGFMPAFILSHLSGVSIPLNGGAQSKPVESMNGLRGEFEMGRPGSRGIIPRIIPSVPPADPNRPAAADPNAVSAAPVRSGRMVPAAEQADVPLQDQVDAEKLLAGAKIEIETCRTKLGKSPAKGVTACKTVLEKYPGTLYAEQAKDLLRRVPERYWDTYEIAELLGY